MSSFRFKKGLKICRKGKYYSVEKRLPNGTYVIEDEVSGFNETIDEISLLNEYYNGEITVVGENSLHNKFKNKELAKKIQETDISLLPEDIRDAVHKRMKYVRAVIDNKPPNFTSQSLIPIIEDISSFLGDTKPPSALTLYRWTTNFLQTGNVRVLIPMNKIKGSTKTKSSPEMHENTILKV